MVETYKPTSRQAGPDMRIIAIPARPGAVETAYMVSSTSGGMVWLLCRRASAWCEYGRFDAALGANDLGWKNSSPSRGVCCRCRADICATVTHLALLRATAVAFFFIFECVDIIPNIDELLLFRTRL